MKGNYRTLIKQSFQESLWHEGLKVQRRSMARRWTLCTADRKAPCVLCRRPLPWERSAETLHMDCHWQRKRCTFGFFQGLNIERLRCASLLDPGRLLQIEAASVASCELAGQPSRTPCTLEGMQEDREPQVLSLASRQMSKVPSSNHWCNVIFQQTTENWDTVQIRELRVRLLEYSVDALAVPWGG